MTFKYTRSKQLPATITHSLHAFLSIVLCFTGKMTFQHFQLQSQGATVCGCAGPEKPQKLGGLSCWVTSLLLPPILLQAAPRETPWMDHQAHSLQQTVCRLLLWTAENPPFPSDLIWILYCPCLSGHFPKRKKKTDLSSQENRCWPLLSLAVTLHGPLDSFQRHPMTLCDTGFLCLFPNLTARCLTTPCCVYVFLPSKVWSQWFIELTREGMDSIPSGRIDSLG